VIAAVLTTLTSIRLPAPRIGGMVYAAAGGLVGALMIGGTAQAATLPVLTAPGGSSAGAGDQPAVADPPPGPERGGEPPMPALGSALVAVGGWVNAALATAVAALVAELWLARRRRYRPPGRGDAGDGPGLSPVPNTVAALLESARADPALSGAGAEGDLPSVVPPGGLGLVGAGAADAMRGLLVTALIAADSRGEPGRPRVMVTAAALGWLLGSPPPATAGLVCADDATIRDAAGPSADGDVLVLLGPADAVYAGPIGRNARVVALGPLGSGRTWDVTAGGRTRVDGRDMPGPRLSVLSSVTAADILNLVREARPLAGAPATPRPPTGRMVPAPAATAAPVASPNAGALRVRLLGTLAVHATDERALRLTRRSAGELLVLLLLTRAAGTDDILDALWPGVRRHTALPRLHTTVSELRRTFRDALGHGLVTRTDTTYRLDPTRFHVDLWQLQAAAARAATAPDASTRHRALHDVARAYTGELAADLTAPWLVPHREAARRHVVDALASLAAEAADPARALAHLQAALGHDPYNEEIHRRIMRAHAALGDPGGIHLTLRHLTNRLADLHAEPEPATLRLVAELGGPGPQG
jgi:DNA-binding SARP family transcriptional activator